MKKILSILLILCTLFILCACPGGGPEDPPVGNECPDCGKNPCECPDNTCPDCGKNPCECPPPDTTVVFGEGKEIEGTGDSLATDADVLTEKTYDESSAKQKPAARFFAQVDFDGGVYAASGTATSPLKNANDKVYGGNKLTVLILKDAGAEIAESKNITLKNLIIVGDMVIESGDGIIFENVQFNGKLTVKQDAEGVVFNGCRFSSLDNAGTDTTVINSYIPFTGVGITDSGVGLSVQNCRLEGTGTAISSTGAELDVRLSTVKTDKDGIGVEMRGARSYNSVVALCAIRGVQKSVVAEGVFNTVVVRNSLISVHTNGGKNIYVCDNEMGGRLFAENNNYFLADGNTYTEDGHDHRAIVAGNENINGDTITNVDERLEVGANEALLPHGNKDQFVGMERKSTVKEYGVEKESTVYQYIADHAAKSDYVVVAPGAYAIESTMTLGSSQNDTTIYAYGVLVEGVQYEAKSYNTTHIRITGAKNISIKGLAIGYAQQTCGQVYVLEKKNGKLTVVTGAGMWNEFGNSGSNFFDTTGIGIQRAGTYYAIGDFSITSVTKNGDGTMTISLPVTTYDVVKKGDILTCRLAQSNTVVSTQTSENILYMDMTQYGYSGGYAFQENSNIGQVTYYRVLDTSKSGMIIDEATYDKYRAWQDEYGVDLEISIDELSDGTLRYRGSPAHISSIDATHVVKNAVGSRVISCLFENMCDDGTNQRSNHARLSEIIDNGRGTTTIIYKANLSERTYQASGSNAGISSYCADFRVGDRVFIYTSTGQLVCDGEALSATVYYDTVKSNHETVREQDIKRYAVTVKTTDVNTTPLQDYDLTSDSHLEDDKVLVDNMSRASNGFHFENMVVQNVRSRGLLIKASDGTVKNCTFRNIAKVAVAVIYEIFWGESGVSENILIENNLIDHTSYSPGGPAIDSDNRNYKHVPIAVMGLGGKSIDPDFLLYKNITITGNKLVNRCLDLSNYAIYLRAVCDVAITNNDFGYSEEEDGRDKICLPLYLSGAMNVELSGNTYSSYVEGNVSEYVHGKKYQNIFGTDVEKDGVSQIEDNL